MSTFNPFNLFMDIGRNQELANLNYSAPSRTHDSSTNRYFSKFDWVPSQEPTTGAATSQQRSDNRSISSRDASSQVLPRSSVTSHLWLHECPNIIEPDEDKLVDRRLLDHLAEMSQALGQTYHGAWTREERVRAIMSLELLWESRSLENYWYVEE